jgi:predicted DCC family thiol-disulfide oxidoreductase YuxK
MNNVIIFDGVCNLCNGFVDFIIKRDKKKIFHFVSNQDDEGKKILSRFPEVPDGDAMTIYYLEDGKLYSKSQAVLRIAKSMSAPYNWFSSFRIFPLAFRNFMYNFIARNRYKWFGKRDTCRVPSSEERERFL